MIKEALNPAAPPRASAPEAVSAQPVAAFAAGTVPMSPPPIPDTPGKTVSLEKTQSRQPKRRVQALHAFTAMQADDLSFMPGAVIVVTDSSKPWWEGYVERVRLVSMIALI